MDPYAGCEHACQYCHALAQPELPSEQENDFLVRIGVKTNAAFQLKKEIGAATRSAQHGKPAACTVIVGSLCDPYQAAEKEHGNTRTCLEILLQAGWRVALFTRSDLVLRDMDLLTEFARRSAITVVTSVPIINSDALEWLEPICPKPRARFKTMKRISKSGIPCCVALAPVFPYISEEGEVDEILGEAADSGARFAIAGSLILKGECRERLMRLLQTSAPELVERYNLIFGKGPAVPKAMERQSFDEMREICLRRGLELGTPFIRPRQPAELWKAG